MIWSELFESNRCISFFLPLLVSRLRLKSGEQASGLPAEDWGGIWASPWGCQEMQIPVHFWKTIAVRFCGWRFCDPNHLRDWQDLHKDQRSDQARLVCRVGGQTCEYSFGFPGKKLLPCWQEPLHCAKAPGTPAVWMQEVGKEQRLAYWFWLFVPGCQNIRGSIAMTYRLLKHRPG